MSIQVKNPLHTLEIQILEFDKGEYTAWIKGDDYKGIVVQAESIHECMKELGISLKVLESYRKNIKKTT